MKTSGTYRPDHEQLRRPFIDPRLAGGNVAVLRPRRVARGVFGPRYRRWKVRWRPRVMLLCHIGGAAALVQLVVQVAEYMLGGQPRRSW